MSKKRPYVLPSFLYLFYAYTLLDMLANERIVYQNCQQLLLDQFIDNNTLQSQSFSLIHFNIWSLSKHYDELVSLLDTINLLFSIIALSETWLHSKSSLYNIPSYNLITQNRSYSQGGGVGLYIHSSSSYK